jgi:hypothetical protein
LLPASVYLHHCLLAAEKAGVFLLSKKNTQLPTSKTKNSKKNPSQPPFFSFRKKKAVSRRAKIKKREFACGKGVPIAFGLISNASRPGGEGEGGD